MDTENKTTIFYITENGLSLAERLKGLFKGAQILKFKSENMPEMWNKCKNLIFIMATGIVVRSIAPLIKNKRIDPAVVVLDEKGRYAISLLSGHMGGANELAKRIGDFIGAETIITTASDINNLTSIDLWAKGKGLIVENEELLPRVSTLLINNGLINVYSELELDLPPEFLKVFEIQSADLVITNKKLDLKTQGSKLVLRPKNLIVGIGFNSGTTSQEIEDAVKRTLDDNDLSFLSINSLATIDKKANESGLIEFSKKYGIGIISYSAEDLNSIINLRPSAFNISEKVFKATGTFAVSEPAALLASGSKELLVPKKKIGNVTVAISEITEEKRQKTENKSQSLESGHSGKLYIIGTGPGSIEHLTKKALMAIHDSDIIVGYSTYLELIKDLINGKEVFKSGMTEETERAKRAVEFAMKGKVVSVISGGDAGIYGMAGLVLEMLRLKQKSNKALNQQSYIGPEEPYYFSPEIEIIPGISALNACGSRLGAPLMHDFAVISLSDRLTEWSLIEKRLEFAAMGDFVTVLYNPKSKGRPEHINRARDIFLKHRSQETPVGIVNGAMRDNEKVVITNLKDMLEHEINMETTIIIGNSQTYVWNNWIITPRGYEKKYKG